MGTFEQLLEEGGARHGCLGRCCFVAGEVRPSAKYIAGSAG